MKTAVKDIVKDLHDRANDVEDCVSLLQTSFIYNSLQPLNECRRRIAGFAKDGPELIREVAGLARENPDLKPYVSVPVHLSRIGESIVKLADCIERMIREHVLFSDRAIEEITFLLQRLIDLMRPTADIILARNAILGKYVAESETGIVKRALEYATLHEERLIEGLCIPYASSLYINMLDEIKNVAWHAKEIATKLTADMPVAVH